MSLETYQKLEVIFNEINTINEMSSMLHWDAATMMPKGGHADRTKQLTYLASNQHTLLTSRKVKNLLDKVNDNHLDDWQKANFKKMLRLYKHAATIPNSLQKRLTESSANCEMIWRTARGKNDYKGLSNSLREVIKITQEIANIKSEIFNCDPYDALLDQYDPYRKSAEIDIIFKDLSQFLQNTIPKIMENQSKSKTKVIGFSRKYAQQDQLKLSHYLMEKLGFDFNHGRLDVSIHPFCGGIPQDSRITTKYDQNNFLDNLSSVLHETGHAIYQQNLPKKWLYQPVGGHLGMSMHESQSLLIEKKIGLSRAFFKFATHQIQEIFGNDAAHQAENLYNISNQVAPSLIRIEADEVTYPCHIILRYNIERMIVNNQIKVEDIPEIWNESMQQLLGIKPDSDKDGCMQDIHWPSGFFGYFPTYTLGAIIANQVYNQMESDIPDLEKLIELGNFNEIVKWLSINIYNKGSRYNTSELLTQITGQSINLKSYKEYITNKYLESNL